MESPNYDFEKLVELVIQVSDHMEACGVLMPRMLNQAPILKKLTPL